METITQSKTERLAQRAKQHGFTKEDYNALQQIYGEKVANYFIDNFHNIQTPTIKPKYNTESLQLLNN